MPKTNLNKFFEAVNWRKLLERILPEIDFDLEITEKHLVIKANAEDENLIITSIQQALDTPEAFESCMPFKIVAKKSLLQEATITRENYPAAPVDQLEAGLTLLETIYGKAEFDELSGLELKKFFKHNAEGVLYTKPCHIKSAYEVMRLQINYFLTAFRGIDLNTARAAYVGKQSLQMLDEEIDPSIIEGLITKCFGVIEKEDPTHPNKKTYQGFCDYYALWQLLFPPKPTVEKVQNEITLQFPLEHFCSYMAQLFNDGYLLMQEGNQAHLLVMANTTKMPQPPVYEILLDVSDSMGTKMEKMRTDIFQFAKKMWKKNSLATIRLTCFSTETQETITYEKKESKKLQEDLQTIAAHGWTRLFGTLIDKLTTLQQEQTKLKKEKAAIGKTVIILCTDGEDNISVNSISDKKILTNSIVQQLTNFGTNCPHVFAIGVPICDVTALKTITKATGGEYIENPEVNFAAVLQYDDELAQEMKIWEFVVRVGEASKQVIKAPVVLDGTLQTVGSFSLSEAEFSVATEEKKTTYKANQVKQALTISDEMLQLQRKMVAIMESDIGPYAIKQNLIQLKQSLAQLDLKPHEEKWRTVFGDRITKLQQAIINGETTNFNMMQWLMVNPSTVASQSKQPSNSNTISPPTPNL